MTMLSICEITEVAPGGFLATSQRALPHKFPEALLCLAGGRRGAEARWGPRCLSFPEGTPGWTVEVTSLSGRGGCFTSCAEDHFQIKAIERQDPGPRRRPQGLAWVGQGQTFLGPSWSRGAGHQTPSTGQGVSVRRRLKAGGQETPRGLRVPALAWGGHKVTHRLPRVPPVTM